MGPIPISQITMKKHLLLIMLFVGLLSPINSFAQSLEDVVYLKNGSAIRGVIIEQVPNESLKIQTRDGNVLSYSMVEVEKLTKERSRRRNLRGERGPRQRKPFNKPQGFMKLFEAGGGVTSGGGFGATRASVSMIVGYRLNPHFAVGVGAGAEGYFYTWYVRADHSAQYQVNGPDLSLPLFLHLRSDILKRSVSPYVSVNLGYCLPVIGHFKGAMLDSSMGVGFNIGPKNRMTVGVGYIMNQADYTVEDSWQGYLSGSALSDGFKLKVGLSF